MNATDKYNDLNGEELLTNTTADSVSFDDFRENNFILRLTQLYIEPIIGVIGLVGNAFTFLLLSKLGLKKPSNMLIMSLTLADCMCLMRSVNVVHLVARFHHPLLSFSYYGWEAPENLAYFLLILDTFTYTIEYFGTYVATGLPVLITMERFIATFFPLKFKTLVTPKRVFIINLAVWIFWAPWIITTSFIYSLRMVILPKGQTIGYHVRSQLFLSIIETFNILDMYVFNFLSSIVPVSLVCIGSICIGVKIKLTQRQRKLMTSSAKTSSLRTTRTLLSVSLIFALIHGTYFILSCVFINERYLDTTMLNIMNEIEFILLQLCESCNFFVYIILNSKYRQLLVNMFTVCVSRCRFKK